MIQEKFVLFLCGVIMKKLGQAMKHDIVKRLINSSLNNYQKEELILRNGSNFVFEGVGLLSYHIHKTSLKRKSLEWVANAIINPKNVDDRCFEYSIVVALHHKEI